MSLGDSFRISRNRAIPGSICLLRINVSACSYVAGWAGDCAAIDISSAISAVMIKQVLKNGDFTGLEYNDIADRKMADRKMADRKMTDRKMADRKMADRKIMHLNSCSYFPVFHFSVR